MKTLLPVAALGFGVIAGAASAGSLATPVAEPVVAPAAAPVAIVAPSADWSGFYAGGSLGYGKATMGGAIDDEGDGLTYGGFAGYQKDLGNFVVGGEFEARGADIEGESSGVGIQNELLAKVRAGYDAGKWLPYATVGYSQLTTDGTYEGKDTGWVAGVGVDYALTDSMSVGAEVLKHTYEDFDNTGTDVDMTSMAVRATFHF